MSSNIFPRPHLTEDLRAALVAARQEVLDQLLRTLRWVALAALAAYTATAYVYGTWPAVGLYAVLFVALLALSRLRRAPYAWRAGAFVALVFLAAVLSLVTLGVGGSGRVYLLTFAVLTTIFFGARAGLWAAGVSLATWFAVGAVFSFFNFEPAGAPTSIQWVDWLSAGTSLLMLIVSVILPQRQFLETQAFALATSQQKRELEEAQQALTLQAQELERASLQLGQANLELMEKSRALERRAAQWAVSAEVAREATTLHEVPTLLDTTVRLVSERFGFYHAGLFLLDETGEWAVLRAASSEGGQRMLARGHRLRVGQQGIVGFVTATGQPRIALNVGEDAVHFRNPDLPETQSEMAVPMRGLRGVIGALDVQSKSVNAFTDDDIAAIQTLADQLAVAIDKARLFEETQRQLAEMRALQRGARPPVPLTPEPAAYHYDGVDVAPIPTSSGWPVPEAASAASGGVVEVPIRLGEDTLGVIALKREAGDWSPGELQLAEAVAERMGLALQSARLFLETQASARRMAALSEAVLEITGPQFRMAELLERIAQRAARLMDCAGAAVWLPVPGTSEIELAVRYHAGEWERSGQRLKRGEDLAGEAFATGRLLHADAALAAPLVWQADILGILTLAQDRPGPVGAPEDDVVVQLFATAAASALANTRLLEQTRRRLQELETLNSIGAIVSSQADLYTMLRQIGDKVLNIFGVRSGYIGLYDSATNLIEFPYFMENGVPAPTPPVPLGQGLSSIVIQTRQPLLVNRDAPQRLEALGAIVQGHPALSYLGVPIVVGDDVIGILNVQSTRREGLFNEDDQRLLAIIGASVGVAIENARLFQQTQTALAETEALYQASADLNTTQNLNDLLAGLRRHTLLGHAQTLQLNYFDRPWTRQQIPESREVIARWTVVSGLDEPLTGRQPLAAWLTQNMRADQPLLVEDVAGDPRLDDNARAVYLIRFGAQSALFLPLVAGGDWVGYLAAFFNSLTSFADAEVRRLTSLTRQAAVLVENFRNVALIERRAQQLLTAAEVSRAAISLTNTEELITQTTELIRERFGLYYTALFLADSERHWAVLVYATGEAGRQLMEQGHRLEIGGNSMIGWAIRHRRARIAQDVDQEKIRFANPYLPDTRSEMALPLIVGDSALGALSVQSTEPNAFSEADITILQTMADQIAIAIRNAQVLGDLRLTLEQLDYERFLLQTLLENVPDKIYFKDQHSRFLRVSAAVAAQFGLPPEQIIGKSDFDFFSDEHARQAYQDEQDLMRTARPVIGKLERETWPDRPDTWVLTSKLPLRDPHGRVMGTFGISRDVTDLKRAQEEAQRRAQQLFAAAEVSRVVTSLLDERDIIARSVELIRARFGLYYVALFLVDETGRWAQLKHASGGAADAGRLLLRLGHQLEVGGKSMIGWAVANRKARISDDVAEETVRFANPLTPETRSEMALPLAVGETVLGAISVQSTQRQAFAEADIAILQTMADQIAGALQNARLFRRVAIQESNASALAHLTRAVTGRLEEAEVWETLAAELLGAFQADGVVLYRWEPEGQTFIPRTVATSAGVEDPSLWPAPGAALPAGERPDLLEAVTTRTGKVRPVQPVGDDQIRESMTMPVLYQDAVDSVIEVVHTGPAFGLSGDDFSLLQAAATAAASAVQIARLYALQRETAERLLEVDRLKSQFLANMSHELRTPLNSIIGFSRVILKGIDGPINDTQKQDLSSIYNSGQHLLGLINDILDLSRIEAGKMELSFDEVHLPDIFEGVLATTRGLIKDRPIQLLKDYRTDLPTVRADSTRVRQVLLNLLSNAAKFTEQGTITLGARTVTDEAGAAWVEIRVADTGQGIPAREMPKLFERFSQVDGSPTRKAGGTGLGLNITRHLVELHGGRIWAESAGRPGDGATFYVTLPVFEPAPAAPVREGAPPLILVVEDDQGLLTLYRRYLESSGFRLEGVEHGSEAVRRAAELQPAAILLDVFMPNTDGWQVLADLKQDPQTRAIPVIMCTIADERERALQLGAADYLMKPILETDLTRALGKVLPVNGAGAGR